MMETEMAGLVSQLDILVKDLEEGEEKAGIDEVGDYLCGMRDARCARRSRQHDPRRIRCR